MLYNINKSSCMNFIFLYTQIHISNLFIIFKARNLFVHTNSGRIVVFVSLRFIFFIFHDFPSFFLSCHKFLNHCKLPALPILKIISSKKERGDRVKKKKKKTGGESITNGLWQWREITRRFQV